MCENKNSERGISALNENKFIKGNFTRVSNKNNVPKASAINKQIKKANKKEGNKK